MRIDKRFIFIFFCIGSLLICAARSSIYAVEKPLTVITTIFPAYDFVRQVGQEKVNVVLLVPPGVEPHAFEPRPADIVKVNNADIFIFTGKYMEPWAANLLNGASLKHTTVLDMSDGIELLDDTCRDERHAHESHHSHAGKDPHIWLDLGTAQKIVGRIADSLARKDPTHKDFYLRNAELYVMKLRVFDARCKALFSACKHRTIIYGGHFAFGYFVRRYGLQYVSPYEGFSPNAEPAPRAIAEIIDRLRQSGQKYIYYEELLDPKVARIIAAETGAKLELLHAAHNISKDELSKGIGFLDIMEENLKKLKAGLVCQ